MSTTEPARRTIARMDGWCPACGEMIEAGTQIVLTNDGRWVHGAEGDECLSEWEGE